MRTYLNIFLFLFLCFPVSTVYCQYYSTGQDPASVRWRQIKTERFRIIFPDDAEHHAARLAEILDLTARVETHTLNAKVPRMPVILHNRSAISNGVTVWAPRRMEFYTCPPQDSYAEEWLEQLAIHEYRHAVQISKMNRGFTKFLYALLGEQAPGAVLGLYIPSWFLEGDATATETALTNTGRGRLPSFSAPLRAQFLQKGIYSYDKATLGSYKHFIPDAYILGYHLVAKSRDIYGPELWDQTLDKVAKLPFMLVPFNAGIHRRTGMWKSRFYRSMMEELLANWQQQEDVTWFSRSERITFPDKKNYTTYMNPVFLNDSAILAAKTSNDGVDELIIADLQGYEKRLNRLGAYQNGSHSAAGNRIAWAEYRPDLRWENRSYSVIRTIEVRGQGSGVRGQGSEVRRSEDENEINGWGVGKVKDLTKRSRYFSPVLSPDGTSVLAVRITEQNRCFIDILDAGNGKIIREFPAPDDGLFLQPWWSPDGSEITSVLLTSEGKTIGILDTTAKRFYQYLPFSFHEVHGPVKVSGKYLLFTGDYSGIENLYAVDTSTRQIFQVTSARFQSANPDLSPDESRMIYSDYDACGMMISEKKIDPGSWIPLQNVKNHMYPLYQCLVDQEGVNIQDSILLKSSYPDIQISRYPEILYLFNVHSWAPAAVDAGNMIVHPGISVLSQNLLSTAFTSAGYDYDLNEQTGNFFLDFSYQGWFPVVDLRYEYGKREGTARYSTTGETFRFTWNESALNADVSIPLNFTKGVWYRRLEPRAGTSWIYVIHDKSTPEKFTTGSVNTLEYAVYAYNYIRSNYQDMFPRWGQNLYVTLRHTPFDGNDLGSIAGAQTNLYFPGILQHHGIRFYTGYQRRWDKLVFGYQFSNIITYPRGITQAYDEELISLSANYKFPFLRIDASLGSILYIKRFKLNLFYDYAKGWNQNSLNIYRSTGAELTSDLHILRFYAPVELGLRATYLPEENKMSWNFLWGISF